MIIPITAANRNNVWALLIFVLLFSVPRSIHAQAPYRNPVVGDPNHVDPELADPFVLKWNGEYFLYASGSPITAYHSTDLVHWDFVRPVLRASEAPEAARGTFLRLLVQLARSYRICRPAVIIYMRG